MYAHKITDKSKYVSIAAPLDGSAVFQAVVLSHSPAFFTAALLTSYQRPVFQTLTLEPPSIFDGVRVQTVRGRFRSKDVPDMPVDIEMKIGETDHLLREAILRFHQNGAIITSTELNANGSIKVNPDVPDSLFTFTPPPGATRVQTLDPGEQYYDPAIRPGGSPAPMHATDIKGNRVGLRDYRGKVVLLDYWATWCAPCLGELPNLRAAYAKYHRQGLDVISISLDDESTRARLPAFAKKHGMAWPQVCDGKGFDSPLATPYKISAIPFSLLIGRDRKIAAVDPRGPELEKAIRAALARK